MSQDNQSCLRFSVEESVWFQKGQEVSQLLSISLEPEVAIQEYENYVSIRGALTLTGEYEMLDNNQEEQSLREYTSGKQIEDIRVGEEGVAELTHQFPVDITIPKNRIQSINEVYVSIDSFDYELPKSNCLQLTADLSIAGLYGEQQSIVREEAEEEDTLSYDIDVQIEEKEEVPEAIKEEDSALLNREAYSEEDDIQEDNAPEEQADEPQIKNYFSTFFEQQTRNEIKVEKEADLYEPFEVEVKKENPEKEKTQEKLPAATFEARNEIVDNSWTIEELEEENSRAQAYEAYVTESRNQAAEDIIKEAPDQKEEQDVKVSKKETDGEIIVGFRKEEKDDQANRKENALYLTKLFSKGEEEAFSKWKLCIVQTDDSLEKIAQRYGVNLQLLLRVNNLESEQDIEEGQILNIPVTS